MTDLSKSTAPAKGPDATANDRFTQAKAARTASLARREARNGTAQREREPDLGGQRLKLAVIGEIPGHHMYWENDEDGKIEQLLFDGFDFVDPGEVSRASDLVADMDLTNRISRYVGRREDGSALRAYLMKCPNEIWDARKAHEQLGVDEKDRQIREGRMQPTGRNEYVPKGYESKLETNAKV